MSKTEIAERVTAALGSDVRKRQISWTSDRIAAATSDAKKVATSPSYIAPRSVE